MVTRYNLFYTVVTDVVRSAFSVATIYNSATFTLKFQEIQIECKENENFNQGFTIGNYLFLSILPQKGVRNLQKS